MEEEQRFKELFRYIMELANGNFSYRLRINGKNNLETMATLLNMLAEELQAIKLKRRFDPDESLFSGMLLVTNGEQQIVAVNQAVIELLGVKEKYLEGSKITKHLTEESGLAWEKRIKKTMKSGKAFQFALNFKTGGKFNVKRNFSVFPLMEMRMMLVNELPTEVAELEEDYEIVERTKNETPGIRFEGDLRKIKEVHDFVLKNVYNSLPSLKEMANMVGTNEHKLKSGFKEIYGNTIFRYQAEKRLRQAELLIKDTFIPLKTIANSTGFKSQPHFTRSFKKVYGCSPREYRKRFE